MGYYDENGEREFEMGIEDLYENDPAYGYPGFEINTLTTPSEVRVVDPDTGGAKGQKIQRTDLLPADTLLLIAEHYGKGAEKYDDRNWERGYAYSLSYGALLRHLFAFWAGEDIDEETDMPHLSAVAFHSLALLTFFNRGIGTDDRP